MRILIIFGGLEKSVSPLIFIFHTQKLNPKSYSNILEKSSYFISHGFASSWGVKTVDEVSLITQSWPDVMWETISFLLDVSARERELS